MSSFFNKCMNGAVATRKEKTLIFVVIIIMTYLIDPLGQIGVWTAAVDDSSTVGFWCLVQ